MTAVTLLEANNSPNALAEMYESYRPLLFSIAYRMTGSATEAEDILQEGYLRFQAASPRDGEVASMRAYLSTIVVRLCLDHLKRARVERDRYTGPWLPEPILTAPDPAEHLEGREALSLALLVLLETLSPEERASFVLHEAFGYAHEDIAAVLGKSPDACRQLLRRARQRLNRRDEGQPRFTPAPVAHDRLVARFLAAAERGDVQALAETLAQDVVTVSDGGGKVHAARRPIVGREAVLRFFSGLLRLAPPNTRFTRAEVNGEPAMLTWTGESLINVVTFEVADGLVQNIRIVVNPDKLAYIQRQRSQ